MKKKKGKLEMETLGKLLLLTAFLIIFLVMFKGCKDSFQDGGTTGIREYFCWGTNVLNSEVFILFPTTCAPETVRDVDKEKLASLMRRCWWMYGGGEEDFGYKSKLGIDRLHQCYALIPKEDIELAELENYIQTHGIGEKELKAGEESTTWNYIQTGSKDGICFDKKTEGKLLKGKTYYITFYDETKIYKEGVRDRLLISRLSKFGEEIASAKGMVKSWFRDDCYDIGKEEMEGREAAEKKRKALEIFNEAVSKIQRCSRIQIKEDCICDDSELRFSGLPKGYGIKLDEETIDKSSLTLYDEQEKQEKKEIFNTRISYWSIGKGGSIVQGTPRKSFPIPDGSAKEPFRLLYKFDTSKNEKQIEIVTYDLDDSIISALKFCRSSFKIER
ncbi:MAG: hypothetical protein ISS23_03515 [Nanoarchaeota archaeon]|nr:hypothetical protein [Nanoarchaeota archaeon]